MNHKIIALPAVILISGLFSFFTGFLFGGLEGLFLVIGFLPVLLGRVLLGKKVLDHIFTIYAATVVLQALLHLPAELYPEVYLQFFTRLLETVLTSPSEVEAVLQNLESPLTFKAILGSVIGFTTSYTYREGYFTKFKT